MALTIPSARVRARFAHWLVCGPLGHLAAGATDLVTLLARWKLAQYRERRARRG